MALNALQLAKQLFDQFNQQRDHTQKPTLVQQAAPVVQRALPVINTIGKTIGQQPIISQNVNPGIQSPTLLQTTQAVTPIIGGTKISPLSSFLSGNTQKALPLIKSNINQFVQNAKEGNPAVVMGTLGGENVQNLSKESANYLSQLTKSQAIAKGEAPFLTKVRSGLSNLKTQLIDAAAPIEDLVTSAEKTGKFSVRPTSDIRLQIDRVLRSPTLANQFAQDNGLLNVIKQAPDIKTLDQYMIAKQASRVGELGIKTGRNAVKDAQLVKELAPIYEPYAQQVNQYSRKLLNYSVDSGLISRDLAVKLVEKYPNYVPLNRIFSELETNTFKGAKQTIANLSKQTVVQTIKGSERQIQSPIQSLLDKTVTAFQQGERNIAAKQLSSYRNLPGFEGLITPLRTAENVTKRIDLYSQAKELKPIQNKLARLLQTRNKWSKKLLTEISNLNKQGLYTSLKQKFSENPEITSSIQQTNTYKKSLVNIGTDKFYAPELTPKIKLQQKYAIPTKTQLRNIINNLVNLAPGELDAIKSKIATRENKLAPILDQIKSMNEDLQGVKDYRTGLFDEARALRDAKSKGLATFSVLNNGIKEIYQTTPAIASAAKNLDKEQMNLLMKIVAFPTRVLRLGATSLNIPFTASNLVKDQMSIFLNSNQAAKTSLLNPNAFLKALYSSVKHDALYEEAVRNAAVQTSFDIGRSQGEKTITQIRSGRSAKDAIFYTVKHPETLLRGLEEIIGKSEELGRVQSYKGTYDALIKQGRTPQDAKLLAAQAARNNTANFARGGNFSKVLNYVIPYFNAGVQGARADIRAFQQQPLKTSAKYVAGLFLPVAATTLWNISDPARKAVYDDIPDYEKQNNLIIIPDGSKLGKSGKYNVIRIPVPPGIGGLASVVRRGIEAGTGGDPVTASEVLGNITNFATSINPTQPNQLLSQTTPQIIKPFVESATNTNLYTGLPIVPGSKQQLPPSEQYRSTTLGDKTNTSPVAMNIAKIIKTATGNDISPLIVENFIRTAGGGVGSQLLGQNPFEQTTNKFTQATGGEQVNKQYKEIAQLNQQGAVQSRDERVKAEGIIKVLTDPNATPQQKAQARKDITSKAILDRVREGVKYQGVDVTPLDKSIRAMAAPERAIYLRNQFKGKSPQEKAALWSEYTKKGLITAPVYAEIQKILKSETR